MTDDLEFFVDGVPVPFVRARGERVRYTDPRERAWRDRVARATLDVKSSRLAGKSLHGVVSLELRFFVLRPKSHFTRDGSLKAGAPRLPSSGNREDVDNLGKPVMDALEDAGLFGRGDGQVQRSLTEKFYATRDEPSGVRIMIRESPALDIWNRRLEPGPDRPPRRLPAPDAEDVWQQGSEELS